HLALEPRARRLQPLVENALRVRVRRPLDVRRIGEPPEGSSVERGGLFEAALLVEHAAERLPRVPPREAAVTRHGLRVAASRATAGPRAAHALLAVGAASLALLALRPPGALAEVVRFLPGLAAGARRLEPREPGPAASRARHPPEAAAFRAHVPAD